MAGRRGGRKKGRGGERPPDGRIRRSQLITTYGPGAMVDLVDAAVIIWGLDAWRPRGKLEVIEEQRLRARLAPRLKREGVQLAQEGYFRSPPGGDDKNPSWGKAIKATEFPRWFVCQHAACRRLLRVDTLERRKDRYWHDCQRKPQLCVPVRFVAACEDGHIQDFPWKLFVHGGLTPEAARPVCDAPRMQLLEGRTGDFSGVRVRCSCGAARRLAEAKLEPKLNPTCLGLRPWLGSMGREPGCENHLQLMVRTASNSYFSVTESALSIPDSPNRVYEAVQDHWATLQVATAATLPAFRTIPKVGQALAGYSDAEVLDAVATLKAGGRPPQGQIRVAEFERLANAPVLRPGDLPPEANRPFFARRLGPGDLRAPLPEGVAGVTLAYKLREVRVQLGFTRFSPATRDRRGEMGQRSFAKLSRTEDWLPAVEILGEGIFVQLDERAVQAWERRDAVRDWEAELQAGHRASRVPAEFPGARFFLLHSLAHLLITQLSLACGYAASSIRERIYCGAEPDAPMAAILLSTGTPGTEGTLGGLVEQGPRVGHHLRGATELGQLCSNDPVCAQHTPKGDLGERWFDGAACYACLFIAESSCEWFNRHLDRSLVVPVVGQPVARAFFGREALSGGAPVEDVGPAAAAAPEVAPAQLGEGDPWSELAEDCILEDAGVLVAALREANVPLPVAEEFEGESLDLAWPDRRVGVVAEGVDASRVVAAGWVILQEPVSAAEILAALDRAP